MNTLIIILSAVLLSGAGSILLAAGILKLKKEKLHIITPLLVSFAGGTLLGAAFLGMLPKSVNLLSGKMPFVLTLLGLMFFFILEKIILWHYCHNKDCKRHKNASAQLILFGDGLHNFIDGVIIASAFMTSQSFGIVIALSVLAHELPQEIADFGVLIESGFTKKNAVWANLLSGLTAVPAAVISYFWLESAKQAIPYILSFSAASFIYIALADLFPQLHQKTKIKDSIIQILLIFMGILTIFIIKQLQ